MKLQHAHYTIIICYIVSILIGGNDLGTNALLLGVLFYLYLLTKEKLNDK